jgi:hypothetical protein
MPTDINVADGRIANWHRFDAKSTAVVKDRHVLMSNADSETNAREQIQTIWTKLGGRFTPPQVISFNRDDLGLNALPVGTAAAMPATPPAPTFNSATSTSITINVAFTNSLGGSAPISLIVAATLGTATIFSYTTVSWPWPTTATVNFLTASTAYNVSYCIINNHNFNNFSAAVSMSTTAS